MTPEDIIDDIRNALVEWYDQAMDLGGPNFGYMAIKVYETMVKNGYAVIPEEQKNSGRWGYP